VPGQLTHRPGRTEDRSLLVVVLDTAPAAWAAWMAEATPVRPPAAVHAVLNHLVLFLNAFLALRDDNLVAVVASHSSAWYGRTQEEVSKAVLLCTW
jgi:hypothetical protein